MDAPQVHILIDLNGHSKGARAGVLLRRPAPLIVSYLGYPSTSGGLADVLVPYFCFYIILRLRAHALVGLVG
jgi:predicted O-linked N-acetylglucosamine transferase (SPINDLY family)